MGTLPDPRPPDADEIRDELTRLGIAATPEHDHLVASACGMGLGEELRSLIRTAAVAAAMSEPPTLAEERAALPPWLEIGADWLRGGWWVCRRHPAPAHAESAAWRTPHRVGAAARAHIAEEHTPGEPATVRAACDARQEVRHG